ncbi:MAG: class I SAM-dependent methyltransferase [Polyangiaceae bacterium]
MPERDWNAHYAENQIPWDTGRPDEMLVGLVEGRERQRVDGLRALEIGCGTGANARWLAQRGFDVVACDLAPLAIEAAAAGLAGLPDDTTGRCRFHVHDFLAEDLPSDSAGPFDLVFDRGVFHVFDDAGTQADFAARVSALLQPGGLWASLLGSTEGPDRNHGPPRRSLRDIASAVEPSLEIVEVRRHAFAANIPTEAAAWWMIARARRVIAQPSTGQAGRSDDTS